MLHTLRSYFAAAAAVDPWYVRAKGRILIIVLITTLMNALPSSSATTAGVRLTTTMPDPDFVPDVRSCCRSKGVSEFCVDKLCNIREPPNEFDVFEVTSDCPQSLKDVAECLSDGRDHSPCCRAKSKSVENSCLHLCDGSPTKLNVTQWEDYKTYVACLSFNVQSMYACMLKGYADIPGPPLDVAVIVAGPSSASVTWNPPETLPEKVRRYIVLYADSNNDEITVSSSSFKRVVTESRSLELANLNPDTRYVVYVRSMTSSVSGEGDDAETGSLKSEPKYFTTGGVAPEIEPYESEIASPVDVGKTLVCKLFDGGHRSRMPSIIWRRKRDSDSSFSTLPESNDYTQLVYSTRYTDGNSGNNDNNNNNNNNFNVNTNHNRRIHVATLKLKKIAAGDFGVYKCVARNNYGEASADIKLRRLNALRVPSAPPNVTDCCIREGVRAACLSACGNDVANPANASTFESTLLCAGDIPKVTNCALDRKNYGSCCLRQRVPFRCLPICDGASRPSLAQRVSCAEYNTAVFECLLEERSAVPYPPADLRLKSVQANRAIVEWTAVPTADVYHVYYRRLVDVQWQRTTVANTAAVLTNLLQNDLYYVQILSANAAGASDASRVLKVQTPVRNRRQRKRRNNNNGNNKIVVIQHRPS